MAKWNWGGEESEVGRIAVGDRVTQATPEAPKGSSPSGEYPLRVYLQFSDCGEHIRKWSREPFGGSRMFAAVNALAERTAIVKWLRESTECLSGKGRGPETMGYNIRTLATCIERGHHHRDSGRLPKQEAEQWRAIEGYEGRYEVSDLGRVRSLPRASLSSRGPRHIPGGILKTRLDGGKYPCVPLRMDGKRRMVRVHRLVAEAFLPAGAPFQRQVAHLDGSRTNNAASNLKWASNAENSFHKTLHGTHQAGERHPRAKLTADQVADLRGLRRAGVRIADLAREFGISWSQAKRIVVGSRWTEASQSGAVKQAHRPENPAYFWLGIQAEGRE